MNNKLFATVIALLALVTAMTSCSDDSDSLYTTTRDCMVRAATLGTLERTIHTKDSLGKDSTYTVTVQGSYYPLSIDQVNNRIFNADSLPYGTDITRVVFSTFSATGTCGIASLITGQDSTFSTSDSTDFSSARKISVYTPDGLRKRTYTIEIVAHKQEGDAWNWQHFNHKEAFAALENARAITTDDSLLVWGKENGHSVVIKAANNKLDAWVKASATHAINPHSVQQMGGQYFALADSVVVRSKNGQIWTETGSTEKFGHLVAAGTQQLFAISENQIYSSADGMVWEPSAANASDKLYAQAYAGIRLSSPIDATFEDILLLANNGVETNVWKKNIDLKGMYDFTWDFFPRTEENYPAPNLSDMQIFAYDGKTILTGKTTEGNIAPFYVSADNGRTWRTSPDYILPTSAGATGVVATSDKNNFIYAIFPGSGDIWRGRPNRLGWN